MNYLVTGGTGFLGSYVLRRLLQKDHRVIAYDYQPSATSIEQVLSKDEIHRVKVVRGDTTDFIHLNRVCKEDGVERIVHLASLLTNDAEDNPPIAIDIICGGLANVLEVARAQAIKRVVWASSISVYGRPGQYPYEFLPNDAPHHPANFYGACKSFCEHLAAFYYRRHRVDSIALRFSLMYGQGRMRGSGGFTNELINKPAAGEKGIVNFADDVYDWLYVDDAARSVILASEVETTKSRAFNLSGDLRSISEAAEIVRRLIPSADVTLVPGTQDICMKVDASEFERQVGFRSEWTLERGIEATVNDIRGAAAGTARGTR